MNRENSDGDVIIHPQLLDFGVLNVGGRFADRTMTLLNNGINLTKFVVIVGSNPMQVEPKRGTLKPLEKKVILIRAAGVDVGYHTSRIE